MTRKNDWIFHENITAMRLFASAWYDNDRQTADWFCDNFDDQLHGSKWATPNRSVALVQTSHDDVHHLWNRIGEKKFFLVLSDESRYSLYDSKSTTGSWFGGKKFRWDTPVFFNFYCRDLVFRSALSGLTGRGGLKGEISIRNWSVQLILFSISWSLGTERFFLVITVFIKKKQIKERLWTPSSRWEINRYWTGRCFQTRISVRPETNCHP